MIIILMISILYFKEQVFESENSKIVSGFNTPENKDSIGTVLLFVNIKS